MGWFHYGLVLVCIHIQVIHGVRHTWSPKKPTQAASQSQKVVPNPKGSANSATVAKLLNAPEWPFRAKDDADPWAVLATSVQIQRNAATENAFGREGAVINVNQNPQDYVNLMNGVVPSFTKEVMGDSVVNNLAAQEQPEWKPPLEQEKEMLSVPVDIPPRRQYGGSPPSATRPPIAEDPPGTPGSQVSGAASGSTAAASQGGGGGGGGGSVKSKLKKAFGRKRW